ncbi:DeoR family transcriptional regulator [Rummeliibacillus sp. G93]|uniref:DeoR family transcriptional regulator n=1 Tax=Rummeliibacillus sp. G93 TaxID=2939494 RepID=UPI00201C4AA6|nr:DeoR family transcriptional regulator [Rummeliibacillus sp. G93]UQW97922.1 DeoR family transcriptional regulator [Rummeliibacillus sp. G93]
MLPLERQKRIKELISERKHLKITELSELLNVSEMTIHRDVKPLIQEGMVEKTFGGICLAPSYQASNSTNSNLCVLCHKSINDKLAYRLILSNNQIEMACCTHCGLLRHQQLAEKTMQAICPDFLTQTTISAPMAWYVMDTSLNLGCCQPQVLPFQWREHAENFVKGFGGKVYSFEEAMQQVSQKMNGSNNNCCSDC